MVNGGMLNGSFVKKKNREQTINTAASTFDRIIFLQCKKVSKNLQKVFVLNNKKAPSLKAKNFHAVNGGMSNRNFVKKRESFIASTFDELTFYSAFNNSYIGISAYQIVNIICYILFIVIYINASELVTHKCA